MWDNPIYICKNCSTNQKIIFGSIAKPCEKCGNNLTPLNLSIAEFKSLHVKHYSVDLICEMSKLKEENPIDFQIKFNELTKSNSPQSSSSTPKCPTCGSTNIKKISGAKRWLTTGVFGLASSDVGKTMQCNSCGYKF